MGDGERVWAHLVCEQAVPAMGEGFQMSMGSFKMGAVVEKGRVGFLKGHGCQNRHSWVFKGGVVVEMGAVGCLNRRSCRIGTGGCLNRCGCRNGHGWVSTGRQLSKWGRLGFKRALVVEKALVGFQKCMGEILGRDWWC